MFTPPDDDIDLTREHRCLACGHAFRGRFCSLCGERVLEPPPAGPRDSLARARRDLRTVLRRAGRSLRDLVLRPGRLARDHAGGVRQPWLAPMRLFLLANAAYFLLPGFDTFDTELVSQLQLQPYSAWAREQFALAEAAAGEAAAFLARDYAAASTKWSKLMLVALVLLLAPCFALIHRTRRARWPQHLAFATEFLAFVLVVPVMALGLGLRATFALAEAAGLPAGAWAAQLTDDHLAFVYVPMLVFALAAGQRRVYGFGVWRCAVGTVLSLVALLLTLTAYRLLLFVVTMASITG